MAGNLVDYISTAKRYIRILTSMILLMELMHMESKSTAVDLDSAVIMVLFWKHLPTV